MDHMIWLIWYGFISYPELILKSANSESNDVVYEFEENFRTMDPPSDSGDGGSDSDAEYEGGMQGNATRGSW